MCVECVPIVICIPEDMCIEVSIVPVSPTGEIGIAVALAVVLLMLSVGVEITVTTTEDLGEGETFIELAATTIDEINCVDAGIVGAGQVETSGESFELVVETLSGMTGHMRQNHASKVACKR